MGVSVPTQANPSSVDQSERRPRAWFVDIVRLIASIQMINGHTLDALMVESIRHGGFYDSYQWARGLVSVTFLTVAGLAFHLATLARFDAHRASRLEIRKRFRRVGILLLFGYFLGFPSGLLFGTDPITPDAWNFFLHCGVLQSIAVGLLFLEVTTILAKRPEHVVLASAMGAALLIGFAPLIHDIPNNGLWRPFTNYLTHAGGSPFPLFPWTGFMLAGCVLGWVALPQGGRTPTPIATIRLSGVLVGLLALWQALEWLDIIGPEGAPYATRPAFSLEKFCAVVGIVLVLSMVCAFIDRLPRLLRILSTETLFVYVFHLWFLYGTFPGINRRWHHALSLPAALLASLAMVLFTVSMTLIWRWRWRMLSTMKGVAARNPQQGLSPTDSTSND